MGGLLHLVQRGGAWAGCGPTQSPPRYTKCNSPPININGQCSLPTSYYLMWHYNCLWTLKGQHCQHTGTPTLQSMRIPSDGWVGNISCTRAHHSGVRTLRFGDWCVRVPVLFLPRDAMHKRGLCRWAVPICLSVSLTFVYSIFIFFHRRVATLF